MTNNKDEKFNIESSYSFEVYKDLMPQIVFDYYVRKFASALPHFTPRDKDGNIVDKSVERINKILRDTDFIEKWGAFIGKKIVSGNAVMIIQPVFNNFGEETINIEVADNLVKFGKKSDVLEYVDIINNFSQGTIPLLKTVRYGKYSDKSQIKAQSTRIDLNNESQKKINELLKNYSEEVVHNRGFVGAYVGVNNFYSALRNSTIKNTLGFPELLKVENLIHQLDLVNDKLILEIIESGGVFKTLKDFGANSPDDEVEGQARIEMDLKKLSVNRDSIYRNESVDMTGVNQIQTTWLQPTLNIEALMESKKKFLDEIYKILGMSIDYEAKGTNDNNSMVHKSSDSSYQATIRAKEKFSQDLYNIFNIIMKLDEGSGFHNEVVSIEVSPNVQDFRIEQQTLDNLKELQHLFTNADLIQKITGCSPSEAKKMAEDKEKGIKKNMSEFLNSNNNNLTQSIIPDIEFGEVQKPQTPNQGDKNESSSRDS